MAATVQMQVIKYSVALAIVLAVHFFPWFGTLVVCTLPIWAILWFVHFCRKNPSLWQMRRKDQIAAASNENGPPAQSLKCTTKTNGEQMSGAVAGKLRSTD